MRSLRESIAGGKGRMDRTNWPLRSDWPIPAEWNKIPEDRGKGKRKDAVGGKVKKWWSKLSVLGRFGWWKRGREGAELSG